MSSRDPSKEATNFPRKQEACASEDASKTISTASLESTPWLRLKDPRVVRVSRALGGKDRHSKVCTIRGLRDRRVRLSVPTAIQLYDLQDRLGLSQPSKVVDWLLDAAKHEIDELPPLPMQPFHPGQPPIFHQYSSSPSTVPPSLEIDQNLPSNRELGLMDSGMNWYVGDNSSKLSRRKCSSNADDASRNSEEENQELSEGQVAEELVPSSNFSARTTINPNNIPYGSNYIYHHLEPSISVANFPHHGLIASQTSPEDPRSFNFVQTPSTLSLISQTPSYFPLQFITPSGEETDHQHVSQVESMVMSSGLQDFLSNSHARAVPPQRSSGAEMDKD